MLLCCGSVGFPTGIVEISQEIVTKNLIIKQILVLNKLFSKKRFKTNEECIFKHSIVCSALKRQFFSQEILGEEHIPTGSPEENNTLSFIFFWIVTAKFEIA